MAKRFLRRIWCGNLLQTISAYSGFAVFISVVFILGRQIDSSIKVKVLQTEPTFVTFYFAMEVAF